MDSEKCIQSIKNLLFDTNYGFLRLDKEGKVKIVNEVACEYLSISSDNVYNKSYDSIIKKCLIEIAEFDFKNIKQTETQIKLKGRKGYFIHRIQNFNDGFLVLIFPKSENRNAATQNDIVNCEQILDSIDTGIVYHESNGLIKYANVAAQKILGLTLDQLCGRDSFHPEWKSIHIDGSDFPGETHPAMVSLSTGESVYNEIMGVYHPELQQYVWILINSYVLKNSLQNTIDAVFTSFEDITEKIFTNNELEYQIKSREILVDATTKFINIDLEKIDVELNSLLEKLGDFMQVDRFYIFRYDFEKNTATNTHEWCANGIEPQINDLQDLPIENVEYWVTKNKEGINVKIDDVDQLPDSDSFKHVLQKQGIKSIFFEPIMSKSGCTGMVGFDSVKKVHRFTDSEIKLLKVFSELIANIEDRKLSDFYINESIKELQSIYKITQLATYHNLSLDDFFKEVCNTVQKAFSNINNTYVCIEYLTNRYTSDLYKSTQNFEKRIISINNFLLIGNITIYIDEGLKFLSSEYDFIDALIKLITQKYNRDLFENSLKKSEEKYRIIADNNYNWEFWEGPDGNFIYHSPSCVNITGYNPNDKVLENQEWIYKLMQPDDIASYLEFKQKVFKNNEYNKFNFRLITKDGSIKYIEHYSQNVYSESGIYLGIRGTNVDVTEKTLAYNEISKNEKRINNLLNSQSSYVLRTNLQGIHTFWNKAFINDFGFLYNEKGLSDYDSLSSICEYDRHKAIETVSKCISNPGEVFKVQLDKPAKNGSIIHTLWDFVCITDDLGQPYEIQCIGIDITENIQAYKKLEASEKMLESLLNTQSSYVLRTDLNGQHTYWNQAFENTFGFVYEHDLNDQNALKSICEYHHPRTFEAVEKCIANPGTIVKVELDKPSTNNTILTTLWEFVCLTNSNGEPSEIQCIGIDITEKINAEKKIIESEENYKTLFSDSPIPLLLMSNEGVFIDCNKAAESLLKYSRQELIGKKPHEISPEFQPNGLPTVEFAKKAIQDFLSGKIQKFECVHTKSNGEIVLVVVSISVLKYSNKQTFLLAWRDITELRDAELLVKKLSTVTEQNPLGILITDLSGKIDYVNQSLIDVSGYKREDFVGNYPRILKSDKTPKEQVKQLWETITEGKDWKGKLYNKKKDGSIYIAQANIAPIKDNTGKVSHYFAVLEDITEKEEVIANLEVSESRYAELAKYSKTVIWEVNIDGKYTYVNEACFDVFGYKPSEMINKLHVYTLHPKNVREKYKSEGFSNLSKNENLIAWLNPKLRKNKELIWTLSNIKPLLSINGKLIGFRGADTDVTLQISAENKLKESEEKYRLLYNVSPNPIVITNANGKILESNKATSSLISYDYKKIFDLTFLDISDENQRDEFNKIKDKQELYKVYSNSCLQNGKVNFEWILRDQKSNKKIYILVSSVTIDFNGKKAIYSSWKDVTDIKIAQEESNRFKIIFEQATYGAAINNLQGKFVYLNKAFANMHGYEPEELIGKDLSVFHNESQLESVNKLVNQIKEVGEFRNEEVWHVKRDGTEFPTLMSGKLILDENKIPKFISATCIDITDKVERETIIKEQNNKLNAIIDALPDMLYVSDKEGNYLEFYSSQNNTRQNASSNLIGKNIKEVFEEDIAAEFINNIRQCFESNLMYSYEYYLLGKQGNKQIFEARIIKKDDNSVLIFVREITDRKRDEQLIIDLNQNLENKVLERTLELNETNKALVVAQKEAIDANEAKSVFLSRMSHELRTPMNAILGFAQILQMTNLSEHQQKSVSHIINSGNHLLNLINEILDISRIESGIDNLSIVPVDVKVAVIEVIELLNPIASAKSIKINFDSVKSYFVMADKQRLKQIFINVIQNAIKYNYTNGHIWISINKIKNNVRVIIEDNGFGISKNDLDKIFNPFERIGAEKHQIEGTGLGLFVVKQLTKAMNGRFGVQSELGVGSNFWFEFESAENPMNNLLDKDANKQDFNSLAAKRKINSTLILYIEDNISNIELIDSFFKNVRPDLNLISINTGVNAISTIEDFMPKLILLDLHLPDMHGSEILKNIKINSKIKNIPVIIITADATPKQKELLLKMGASHYLTKPIVLKELMSTINLYI